MNTKELADQLDAEDRLRARGYEKFTCEKCHGYGQSHPDIVCDRCKGEGHVWKPPVTK